MWYGSREKGEAYSRVLAKALLGEMSCWDDIPPKKGKDELESLGHVIRVSMKECPTLIRMGMPRIARK